MIAILIVVSIVLIHRWSSARMSVDERRRVLLARCLGDSVQAERLIEGEIRRSPGITRAQAIERAINAHRRDQ